MQAKLRALTLEREVGLGFVARASYAASKGTRLLVKREINGAIYVPGATTATTNQRRPMQPVGNVALYEPVSNSTFQALQLTAERRFAHGFSILANYQWAKAIDDSSAVKGTGITRTNSFDQSFDKDPADFDKRHVFNMSGLWDMPIRFENRAMQSILGGWSLNGIASLWTGYPFTVTSGVDSARTGTGNQRADLIGDPYLPEDRTRAQKIDEWLSRSAFRPGGHRGYVRQSWSEHVPRAGVCLGRSRVVQEIMRILCVQPEPKIRGFCSSLIV